MSTRRSFLKGLCAAAALAVSSMLPDLAPRHEPEAPKDDRYIINFIGDQAYVLPVVEGDPWIGLDRSDAIRTAFREVPNVFVHDRGRSTRLRMSFL